MTPKHPNRIAKLRAKLHEQELEGILISAPPNRRYLSEFTGSAGYLLVTLEQTILGTDFRYTEQAENEARGWEVRRIGGGNKVLPTILAETGITRLGFEADDLSVAAHSSLQNSMKELKLVPTTDITSGMRAVKDDDDLAPLVQAIQISDEALSTTLTNMEPGTTEAAMAWLFEQRVRELGGSGVSFPTIVATGANGAMPHHQPGACTLANGDLVVVDCGALYSGYCSDVTRTVAIGEVGPREHQVHAIVKEAQQAAVEEIRSGMTGQEADAIARRIIAKAGYGANFGHSLGHGVGLEVHERPHVGPTSSEILEDGMVFTIEPGIYISSWGGVRIEDVVILENGRCKVLSSALLRELPSSGNTYNNYKDDCEPGV